MMRSERLLCASSGESVGSCSFSLECSGDVDGGVIGFLLVELPWRLFDGLFAGFSGVLLFASVSDSDEATCTGCLETCGESLALATGFLVMPDEADDERPYA